MIENTVQVAYTAYGVICVVFLLTCARFVLRRLKNEKVYPDDWLMVAALFMFAGNTSSWPVMLHTGGGPFSESPNETIADQQLDMKYAMFSRSCYMTYIWLLKACILLYYYRLTTRQPEQRYVIITFWCIGCTYVIDILMFVLKCIPYSDNWKITDPPLQCQKAVSAGQQNAGYLRDHTDFRQRLGLIFMSMCIIVTNTVLIIIPLPMIWRTQMAMITKLKVSAVFLVGIFLIVVSIIRAIYQENTSSTPDDRYFWGVIECLFMAIFANAPIINALYRRLKSGAGSNHLASRSQIPSARRSDNIELCSSEDVREIGFMEAIRGGPERAKPQDSAFIQPLPPAKLAAPHLSRPKGKVGPSTNMLLSVSRSKGGDRNSPGHFVQSIEVVQTSEPADPNNPMLPNPLGGIGRVETHISHHDSSPLPSNPDLYAELYSSGHRSMTLEDMLAHGGPSRRT